MNSVTQPERGRGTMLPVVVAAAALIALIAFAPFASATSDPVASGTTTLTLNKGFFKKLKKNGVKVLKVSPGTVKNRTVTLPVGSGSTLDPTTGLGTINQSGGIKFKAGKKSVALKSLVLDTTKSSLSGKVGNKSMKIASVAGLSFSRDGFGTIVSIGKLKLTGKAAKQLNKKLGFSGKSGKASSSASSAVFKANQVMGSSSSATQPTTLAVLATDSAKLNANIGTIGKFVSKGVPAVGGITPIAPATAVAAPPSFTFPITGGTISPTATSGTLQTSGGVKIAKPAGATTTLNNIYIDLAAKTATVEIDIEPAPPFPGVLGRSSIADIDLTGATIASDPAARTVTVTNATAKLQAVTAATLNTVYPGGIDFVTGDSLGTFSFTAHTQ
jgi:Htaa